MENSSFTYQYSAEQSREAAAIRKKYVPHEVDKMERLRRLDAQVREAGMIESLCIGIIGALVFGIALCFGLDVFGTAWWPAIPIGVVGIALMLPAYPLCKYLYDKKKEALTPEILKLTEELIGKQQHN